MNPHSALSRHKIRTSLGQTSPIPSRPIPQKPLCTPTDGELAGEGTTLMETETVGTTLPGPTGTLGGDGPSKETDIKRANSEFLSSNSKEVSSALERVGGIFLGGELHRGQSCPIPSPPPHKPARGFFRYIHVNPKILYQCFYVYLCVFMSVYIYFYIHI
jgi:hypothetical protein